jgi:aryl-alcohol dehydrogenase-like predicted oxidoreductase
MKHRYLGNFEVSEIGLGCLSMTAFYDNPPNQAEAIATIVGSENSIHLIRDRWRVRT